MNQPLSNIVPRAPDPRDFTLHIPLKLASAIPQFDYHLMQYDPGRKDQGSLGTCVDFATTDWLETFCIRFGITGTPSEYVKLSELMCYWNARSMHPELVGVDGGSNLIDGALGARFYGICPETNWPYDPANVEVQPTPEAFDIARQRKVGRYEQVGQFNATNKDDRDLDALKVAIMMGYEPLIALPVGSQLRDIKGDFTDPQNAYRNPVGVNGNDLIGFHALRIKGFDDRLDGFIVKNWWQGFGDDKGLFLMKYEVAQKDIFDACVITSFAGVTPTPDYSAVAEPVLSVTVTGPKDIYANDGAMEFTATVGGGEPNYLAHWLPDSDAGAGIFLDIGRGVPGPTITGVLAHSGVTFADGADKKTVTITVNIADQSIPDVQTAYAQMSVTFHKGNRPLIDFDNLTPAQADQARAFYAGIVALVIAGKGEEAKAQYLAMQALIGFTDEQFAPFTPYPASLITLWKVSPP